MDTSSAIFAVLETYPEDIRSLFLDLESPRNPGESTPPLSPVCQNTQVLKQKSATKSARKTAKRRASICARLNAYVRDYSVDLQKLFDDIVSHKSKNDKSKRDKSNSDHSESDNSNSDNSKSDNSTNEPDDGQRQLDQLENASLLVYGSKYLKERLELLQKRSKISVMPLVKKASKKRHLKRKSRAALLDKLQILRKQFQLLKKNESCPSPGKPSQLTDKKTIKKSKKKLFKGKTKIKLRSRRSNTSTGPRKRKRSRNRKARKKNIKKKPAFVV